MPRVRPVGEARLPRLLGAIRDGPTVRRREVLTRLEVEDQVVKELRRLLTRFCASR